MWDLIVSVPYHCLSFYFKIFHLSFVQGMGKHFVFCCCVVLCCVVLCFTALRHFSGHFGRGQLTYLHCFWASLLAVYQYLVHILSPVTDNCPSRISGRRNYFMTKLPKIILFKIKKKIKMWTLLNHKPLPFYIWVWIWNMIDVHLTFIFWAYRMKFIMAAYFIRRTWGRPFCGKSESQNYVKTSTVIQIHEMVLKVVFYH